MTESQTFIRRVSISWDEFDRQSRLLANEVRGLQAWNGIIAVTRGGLVPAATLAYELDIRLVDTVCISMYDDVVQRRAEILKPLSGDGAGFIVVENIVDTGATGRIVRAMLPKAYYVSIFAKPQGMQHADKAMIHVEQDTWVDFPWEMPIDLTEKVSL